MRARTRHAERGGTQGGGNGCGRHSRAAASLSQRQCQKNLRLRSAFEAIARAKNATLAQLSIAWPMAQGSRAGAFIVPIPGAKSRKRSAGASKLILKGTYGKSKSSV